jgi:hypothetical protein
MYEWFRVEYYRNAIRLLDSSTVSSPTLPLRGSTTRAPNETYQMTQRRRTHPSFHQTKLSPPIFELVTYILLLKYLTICQ